MPKKLMGQCPLAQESMVGSKGRSGRIAGDCGEERTSATLGPDTIKARRQAPKILEEFEQILIAARMSLANPLAPFDARKMAATSSSGKRRAILAEQLSALPSQNEEFFKLSAGVLANKLRVVANSSLPTDEAEALLSYAIDADPQSQHMKAQDRVAMLPALAEVRLDAMQIASSRLAGQTHDPEPRAAILATAPEKAETASPTKEPHRQSHKAIRCCFHAELSRLGA